jgi:hypothetical protein
MHSPCQSDAVALRGRNRQCGSGYCAHAENTGCCAVQLVHASGADARCGQPSPLIPKRRCGARSDQNRTGMRSGRRQVSSVSKPAVDRLARERFPACEARHQHLLRRFGCCGGAC